MTALGAGGLVLDGPPMVAPKFATERDLSRPTLGGRQAIFARDLLGQPFMPWQKLVADVAGEMMIDPDTGLLVPRYKLVVVTVQRQSGKSHLCFSIDCERCFSVPSWRSWYTAQTGQDARDIYLKFDEENLDSTLLRPFVRTMRGRGEEVMKFLNQSSLRPHPPTEEKLHGKQSDRNDIDEGWAFEEAHGKALLQAIAPTQLTRPHAQTVVWSAGGTASSTWLAELVARGRAADPDVCYFEWAIPDDLDLSDMAAIAAHHPAYGYTITESSIRALRANLTDDAEFARAAGNRWTEIIGGAITGEQWRSLRHPDAIPAGAPLAFGAARAADGSQVAIACAAEVGDVVVVELLDVLPTAYKAGEHVKGWAAGDPIAVAANGPSAALAVELEKLRTPRFKQLTGQQESAAVTNLLDSIEPRRVRFRQHPDLDAAVQVAGTRGTGDGGKAWARMAAGASIASIEAATYAVWALATAPRRGRLGVITADD